MNVILFGASGMVGGGVLRECLEDPKVDSILSVGRRTCGIVHPKVQELLLSDLFEFDRTSADLGDLHACFFCLGVSAAGLDEPAYRKVTFDLTVMVATVLWGLNPDLTFCFVSGQGTDSSGRGRFMWARVKGETENKLLEMSSSSYMFRPGYIQPLKGVRSRTAVYQGLYTIFRPFFPVLNRMFPNHVTTTVKVGKAMIRTALAGAKKRVLEARDINELAP